MCDVLRNVAIDSIEREYRVTHRYFLLIEGGRQYVLGYDGMLIVYEAHLQTELAHLKLVEVNVDGTIEPVG